MSHLFPRLAATKDSSKRTMVSAAICVVGVRIGKLPGVVVENVPTERRNGRVVYSQAHLIAAVGKACGFA